MVSNISLDMVLLFYGLYCICLRWPMYIYGLPYIDTVMYSLLKTDRPMTYI